MPLINKKESDEISPILVSLVRTFIISNDPTLLKLPIAYFMEVKFELLILIIPIPFLFKDYIIILVVLIFSNTQFEISNFSKFL